MGQWEDADRADRERRSTELAIQREHAQIERDQAHAKYLQHQEEVGWRKRSVDAVHDFVDAMRSADSPGTKHDTIYDPHGQKAHWDTDAITTETGTVRAQIFKDGTGGLQRYEKHGGHNGTEGWSDCYTPSSEAEHNHLLQMMARTMRMNGAPLPKGD